jgi:hypothetical protein
VDSAVHYAGLLYQVRLSLISHVGTVFIASAFRVCTQHGKRHPTSVYPEGGRDEYGPYMAVANILLLPTAEIDKSKEALSHVVREEPASGVLIGRFVDELH